jgi:hypothetical protein
MVDGSQQGPETNTGMDVRLDEDTLRSMFAQGLVDELLSPAVLDRITLRVLDEVHTTLVSVESTPDTAFDRAGRTFASSFERVRHWLRSLTPNQSLLLAGASALAVLLLFVAISRITPRPHSIAAEVKGGDATVLSWNSDKFRVQGDGDLIKLRQGDQILTGEGSVRLSHLPNQVSIIEPGAHVVLTRLDEADGGRQLALTVHDGIVHSQLNSPLQPQDLYIVTTPGVTVSAIGTDFTVETVSEAETLVTSLSGHVHVAMGKEAVTIGPGEEVDAIQGRSLIVQAADGKYDGGLLPKLIMLGAGSGLQLYAQPRTDSAPVGRLSVGRSVTIQAEDAGGNWLQVCCILGKSGWVKIR